MLFKELVDLYIAEILPRKKSKTQKNQRQQLKFWSQALGEKKASEIKPIDIIQARNKLKVSDASKNIYMAALCHVFTIAIKEFDILEINPASKISNLKIPRGRVRFLSESERKELLLACEESSNEYLHLIVLLALTTGARKNEILSLTWGDVDLDRNVIYVHETKNGEIKSLILVSKVKELLLIFYNSQRWVATDLIFKGKKNKPLDIQYPFQQALKRANITDFRFHDLRHTCASYLAMNKASDRELMDVLGHKSVTMVKRYAHLSTHHKASVINDMVDKINL